VDATSCARDAEIDDLHRALVRDEEVLRRDVAVDHVHRLAAIVAELVRRVEPLRGFRHDARDQRELVRRPRRRILRALAQEPRHRLAEQILHRDVVRPVGFTEVEHVADVRVADPRRDARLVEEHLGELLLLREVRVNALERDELLEPRRAGDAREIHRRHPARRELEHELIPPELPLHRLRWRRRIRVAGLLVGAQRLGIFSVIGRRVGVRHHSPRRYGPIRLCEVAVARLRQEDDGYDDTCDHRGRAKAEAYPQPRPSAARRWWNDGPLWLRSGARAREDRPSRTDRLGVVLDYAATADRHLQCRVPRGPPLAAAGACQHAQLADERRGIEHGLGGDRERLVEDPHVDVDAKAPAQSTARHGERFDHVRGHAAIESMSRIDRCEPGEVRIRRI
jgi:hypothetical protein